MSPEEEKVINRNTMKLQEHLYKSLIQRDQYKSERDSLIDDIAVLKANISRLERENEQLKKEEKVNRTKASLLTEIEQLKEKNEKLRKVNSNGWKHENKALRLQSNTYFDEWQTVKNLYTTLTDHIRLKAETNPGVSRYIDLVNYIDRLEDKESDATHHIPHLTNIKVNENIEEPMKFIKRIAKERD